MSEDEQDIQWSELARAYEERGVQLYEARGALAEAVATVTAELKRCRQELDAALGDREELRAHIAGREEEVAQLRRYAQRLEGEVRAAHERTEAVLNLKVVRWSAGLRRAVARLRARVS